MPRLRGEHRTRGSRGVQPGLAAAIDGALRAPRTALRVPSLGYDFELTIRSSRLLLT